MWEKPKKLGMWKFRVKKFCPGEWRAQVDIGGKWFDMLEARGDDPVRRTTRKGLWQHIRYAYGIQKG